MPTSSQSALQAMGTRETEAGVDQRPTANLRAAMNADSDSDPDDWLRKQVRQRVSAAYKKTEKVTSCVRGRDATDITTVFLDSQMDPCPALKCQNHTFSDAVKGRAGAGASFANNLAFIKKAAANESAAQGPRSVMQLLHCEPCAWDCWKVCLSDGLVAVWAYTSKRASMTLTDLVAKIMSNNVQHELASMFGIMLSVNFSQQSVVHAGEFKGDYLLVTSLALWFANDSEEASMKIIPRQDLGGFVYHFYSDRSFLCNDKKDSCMFDFPALNDAAARLPVSYDGERYARQENLRSIAFLVRNFPRVVNVCQEFEAVANTGKRNQIDVLLRKDSATMIAEVLNVMPLASRVFSHAPSHYQVLRVTTGSPVQHLRFLRKSSIDWSEWDRGVEWNYYVRRRNKHGGPDDWPSSWQPVRVFLHDDQIQIRVNGRETNSDTEQEWMSCGHAQPLIHSKMPVVDLDDMHKEQYSAIVDSLGRKLHTRQESLPNMSFNELKSLMTGENRHEAFAVQCVVFDRCSDDMKERRPFVGTYPNVSIIDMSDVSSHEGFSQFGKCSTLKWKCWLPQNTLRQECSIGQFHDLIMVPRPKGMMKKVSLDIQKFIDPCRNSRDEPPTEMSIVRPIRDADIRVLTELQGATCSNTIFQDVHPDVPYPIWYFFDFTFHNKDEVADEKIDIYFPKCQDFLITSQQVQTWEHENAVILSELRLSKQPVHVKLDVQRVTVKKSWSDIGVVKAHTKGWVCTHIKMFDVFRLPPEFANIRTLTQTSSEFFTRRLINVTRGSEIMLLKEKQCLQPRQLFSGSGSGLEVDDARNQNPAYRSMQRFQEVMEKEDIFVHFISKLLPARLLAWLPQVCRRFRELPVFAVNNLKKLQRHNSTFGSAEFKSACSQALVTYMERSSLEKLQDSKFSCAFMLHAHNALFTRVMHPYHDFVRMSQEDQQALITCSRNKIGSRSTFSNFDLAGIVRSSNSVPAKHEIGFVMPHSFVCSENSGSSKVPHIPEDFEDCVWNPMFWMLSQFEARVNDREEPVFQLENTAAPISSVSYGELRRHIEEIVANAEAEMKHSDDTSHKLDLAAGETYTFLDHSCLKHDSGLMVFATKTKPDKQIKFETGTQDSSQQWKTGTQKCLTLQIMPEAIHGKLESHCAVTGTRLNTYDTTRDDSYENIFVAWGNDNYGGAYSSIMFYQWQTDRKACRSELDRFIAAYEDDEVREMWERTGFSPLPQRDNENNLSVSFYRLPYTGDSDSEEEESAEVDKSRFKVMRFETPLDAGHTLKEDPDNALQVEPYVMRSHPSWSHPTSHPTSHGPAMNYPLMTVMMTDGDTVAPIIMQQSIFQRIRDEVKVLEMKYPREHRGKLQVFVDVVLDAVSGVWCLPSTPYNYTGKVKPTYNFAVVAQSVVVNRYYHYLDGPGAPQFEHGVQCYSGIPRTDESGYGAMITGTGWDVMMSRHDLSALHMGTQYIMSVCTHFFRSSPPKEKFSFANTYRFVMQQDLGDARYNWRTHSRLQNLSSEERSKFIDTQIENFLLTSEEMEEVEDKRSSDSHSDSSSQATSTEASSPRSPEL